MQENSHYMQMIRSKQYVPVDGQILFLTDGKYAVLSMDCRVLPEPCQLIAANNGKIMYTFDEDGNVMCMINKAVALAAAY